MDDYISREAAIMVAMDYDGQGNAQDASQDIASGLVELLAADVRSVVYCKDCIHLGFKDFNGICNGPMCGIVKPWDYCSHGARGGADNG